MKQKIIAVALLLLLTLPPLTGTEAQENTPTQQEKNKRVVLAFYEAGLNRKDFVAASRYIGSQYIQHNPTAADGKEGFRQFLAYLRRNYPKSHNVVKRVIAEGDIVALHVHEVLRPGERGTAIVDIYRLESGKIVEHWDVKQPVPTTAANRNTMF